MGQFNTYDNIISASLALNDELGVWAVVAAEFKNITFDELRKAVIDNSLGTTAGTVAEGDHAHTAADIGLGNVDNTSDVNKPISTATQAALDLKATIVYVDSQIASLVDSSPATLDTLNELAAALGDDPNFATTIAGQIGSKLDATATAVDSDKLGNVAAVNYARTDVTEVFNQGFRVDNNQPVYFKDTGGASQNAITLTGSDAFVFGDTDIATCLFRAGTNFKVEINGSEGLEVTAAGVQITNLLRLHPMGDTNEGGEMVFYGAGSYDDVSADNYQGSLRFFDSRSSNFTTYFSNFGAGQHNIELDGKLRFGALSDFYIDYNLAGNPGINFDANDWFAYSRTANVYAWYIGGSLKMTVGSAVITPSIPIVFGLDDNGNSGTSKTVTFDSGNKAKLTLTGNCTITLASAASKAGSYILKLVQDATGGRSVTWAGSPLFHGGTAPDIDTAANAVTLINAFYDGSTWHIAGGGFS